MANDGATNTGRNRQPARPDAPATLPNRNNTPFKIPRNTLKINVEPNPNRNKNSVTPGYTDRKPQIANQEILTPRGPGVANQNSQVTNYADRSRITPRLSPITNH